MNFKKAFINTTLALSLALSASPLAADAAAFKDTKGHWADGAIQWAKDNKITNGYPDGTFKPNTKVSEEEFVSMLLSSFKYTAPKVEVKRWSDGMYAVANSYNYPVTSNRATPLKRYRVAELVAATQGKNYSGDYAIQYVMGNGLASGKVAGQFTIASFKGNDTLTRAEAASFIMKLKENPKASKELLKRPTSPSPVSELPKVDAGGVNPAPPVGDKITDENGRIKLDVARSYEMQVHNSYKFGANNLTLTLPKLPKGYGYDVGLYVEYKNGGNGFLGYDEPWNSGESYTVSADWKNIKEANLKIGIIDVSNGGVRRYSYYVKSTGEIVEKVKY